MSEFTKEEIDELVRVIGHEAPEKAPVGPVSRVEFSILVPEKTDKEAPELPLNGLTVEFTALFGKTRLTLSELKECRLGSIIALDESLNTPLTLEVNGKRVGKGEIVTCDGHYGVKIVELSPE